MDVNVVTQLHWIIQSKIHNLMKMVSLTFHGTYDTKANGTQYGRVSKMINGKEYI